MLYLSEDAFDDAFSSLRALSRNRVIHSISPLVLVAQASLHIGGTWSGTAQNLHRCWSKVCCFDDGSQAALELQQLGALPITADKLCDYSKLLEGSFSLFDQV